YRVQRGGIEGGDLRAHCLKHGVDLDGKPTNLLGEALLTWGAFLGVLLAVWFLLIRRTGRTSQSVLSLGRSKAMIYGSTDADTTFKDVAGIDEAVEEVGEIVDFLKNPEKFRRLGAEIPRGVLLVGLPGTGKTLLGRALAGEAKVPFFHLSGADFVEMFAGLGAARVRDLFKQAKEKAPCVIFLDEIDALGKSRRASGLCGHEEREQTLNALLVELDGFEANTGVVLCGATNRPEMLDRALLRPGRFDRQIVVDRPDWSGRLAILTVHAKRKRIAADVDLEVVAQRTVGLVGADLGNILNEAALLAGRALREEVSSTDVEEAIDRVMAGLQKRNRILSAEERKVVAYHEAGHALVAQLLDHTDKVHKVSIVPRSIAALGFTMQLPDHDRYLERRSTILDRLCVLFGGRAAEEVVFGEVTTGGQDDLEAASRIARSMVTEYGMSERVGLASYRRGSQRYLEAGMLEERAYSEETARKIDVEMKRILDDQYDRAKDTVLDNREAVERIALRLLEAEEIDGVELEGLIAGDGEPQPDGEPEAKPPAVS
ncbi:ATP-dependent zinc metalloprotease FtsH, partial [Planctomycetota bacterium]